MKRGSWRAVVVCSALLVAPVGALQQDVPTDLRPLLAAPQSEMRLVVVRYNADRSTLSGNYAGGNRAGGGRRGGGAGPAGGGAQPIDVPVSPDRIARLKRFDLDWQAALGESRCREAHRDGEVGSRRLKSAIANDLVQLDADAVTLSRVAPAVPFRAALVQLIEVAHPRRRRQLAEVGRDADAGDARSRRAQDAARRRHRGRLGGRHAALEQRSGGDAARRRPRRCARASPSGSASTTATTRCSRGGWGCRTRRSTRRCRTTRRSCATKSRRANLTVAGAGAAPIAAAPAPKFSVGPGPRRDHRAAAGRDARHRRALHGRRRAADGGGRGGAARGGAARATPKFYTRLAGGAEVARLRQALAQRAGRLPLHQVSRRD